VLFEAKERANLVWGNVLSGYLLESSRIGLLVRTVRELTYMMIAQSKQFTPEIDASVELIDFAF
jgi:hypothetical protein